MLKIQMSRQADKELDKIQPKLKSRIINAIIKLAEDPARTDLDIKKLTNFPYYRMRVGQYRVVFDQDGRILRIIRIAPRGSVY